MNQIHSVCVYSASSTKINPVYFKAAEELGGLLAEHHIRLINGAGSIGLMRAVEEWWGSDGSDSSFYGRAELAAHGIDGAD